MLEFRRKQATCVPLHGGVERPEPACYHAHMMIDTRGPGLARPFSAPSGPLDFSCVCLSPTACLSRRDLSPLDRLAGPYTQPHTHTHSFPLRTPSCHSLSPRRCIAHQVLVLGASSSLLCPARRSLESLLPSRGTFSSVSPSTSRSWPTHGSRR